MDSDIDLGSGLHLAWPTVSGKPLCIVALVERDGQLGEHVVAPASRPDLPALAQRFVHGMQEWDGETRDMLGRTLIQGTEAALAAVFEACLQSVSQMTVGEIRARASRDTGNP